VFRCSNDSGFECTYRRCAFYEKIVTLEANFMRNMDPKEHFGTVQMREYDLAASVSASLRYTHTIFKLCSSVCHAAHATSARSRTYIHRRIMTQLMKLLLPIREAPFSSNIGQDTGCPKCVVHCLPQSLQENFRIIPLLGSNSFLPDPFQFNTHHIIRHYMTLLIKALLNNPQKACVSQV
jgi:hypothetical protein